MMVVGLDREQRGVNAKLPRKASLRLHCARVLAEVQSSAAPSRQATLLARLRDQGKDQQPWGNGGCTQLLTANGSSTTRQQSKNPLPENCTVKSFQKATQSWFLSRLLG